MRVLKEYNSILTAARDEFISKSFKNSSIRTTAKDANVDLSNIYNYFLNKDDIFLAILKPAKDTRFSFMVNHHTEKEINLERVSTFNYQKKAIEEYIHLLEKFRQELRLLLYRSEGSSMSNFRHVFTDHLTEVNKEYMRLVKKHYACANEISPFFAHTLSAFMVSIVGEILTHDLSSFRSFSHFDYQYYANCHRHVLL